MANRFLDKGDTVFISVALIAIIFLIILSRSLVVNNTASDSKETIAERTMPIGQVVITASDESIQDTEPSQKESGVITKIDTTTPPATTISGEKVAKANCLSCHAQGLMNAPKVGDKAAWDPRYAQGIDTLVDHAVSGFKNMPAKGGNPKLNEAEIRQAILYMLGESGQDVPEQAVAAAPVAKPEPKQITAVPATTVSGEKVAKASCLSCHAQGLMNAPKVGDKAAWDPRYAQGIDTLVDHAVSGFKNMPAKGGNPKLNEAEIRQAILYMLGESGQDVPEQIMAAVTESAPAPVQETVKQNEPVPGTIDTETADTTTVEPETGQATMQVTYANPEDPKALEKARAIQKAGEPVYIDHCASCHNTGTDHAPVTGQQGAWLQPFSKGIDKLVRDVKKGPPLHPDISGSGISNSQLTESINYIMQKTFWPEAL